MKYFHDGELHIDNGLVLEIFDKDRLNLSEECWINGHYHIYRKQRKTSRYLVSALACI